MPHSDPDAVDPVPPPALSPVQPYDRAAIFDNDGPFQPDFLHECIRTLMRALPLETQEPTEWSHRRMHSAMIALSALHPRDEIEIMLSVQALAAYHAAAACWHLGMNHHPPHGDSTRHLTAAANAARTFDSLLKALERRQVKPLSIPVGRPLPRVWDRLDSADFMATWAKHCGRDTPLAATSPGKLALTWTPENLSAAENLRELLRIEEENQGLDLANTEGILPGGGMIVPDRPTPRQAAYIARRYALNLRRRHEEDLRRGITKLPMLPPLHPGDLVP